MVSFLPLKAAGLSSISFRSPLSLPRRITVNIVYALTHGYYHKAVPSMKSVIEHDPKAKIYLIAEDDEVEGLPCKVTVINVKDQQYFKPTDVNYNNPFTYINLLKVCYPELLRCDKVLHLDADAIVTDSLEELWKTDLTGKWFAAVPEYRGHYNPFGGLYFNAGVILLNLKQMRKDNATEELVRYLNAFWQPYADQDAWNKAAIRHNIAVPLPVRYNEAGPTGQTERPAIVHYCGMKRWWEDTGIPRGEYLDKYRA